MGLVGIVIIVLNDVDLVRGCCGLSRVLRGFLSDTGFVRVLLVFL